MPAVLWITVEVAPGSDDCEAYRKAQGVADTLMVGVQYQINDAWYYVKPSASGAVVE